MGYSKNNIIGVYCITNTINNKKYIGKSISVKERFNCHLKELEHNKHHSFHLQYSYNKYGKENFKFEILATCPEEYLTKIESKFIRIFKSDNRDFGYNIINRENKKSLESRIKLSNSLKNSDKVKQARIDMWKTRTRQKINQYSIDGTFIKTWDSRPIAAKALEINQSCIGKICAQKYSLKSVKGFIFRYYNGETTNLPPYVKAR